MFFNLKMPFNFSYNCVENRERSYFRIVSKGVLIYISYKEGGISR
jgi:hypothetical protein